jgi:putative endonuclease
MNHNQSVGVFGENAVANHLAKLKFIIVERNFRCRGGEIDIIARKENTVIFVEVKTRKSRLLDATQVINHRKQQKIYTAAQRFMQQNYQNDYTFQFDVAIVYTTNNTCDIEYISNAFTPHETGY